MKRFFTALLCIFIVFAAQAAETVKFTMKYKGEVRTYWLYVPEGANASTADGRPAVLKEDAPQRELPKFENALEPKAPPPDESDIYSKPVEQKEKLEEWKM